jgi:cytochrome c biogenesis protein CcdA
VRVSRQRLASLAWLAAAAVAVGGVGALLARPAGSDVEAQVANALIRPDVTPLVESPVVPAGGTARLAVRISLPEGLHIQSDKPRDPLLIPAVLWLDPPEGVTTVEVVFPPATDFAQQGVPEPLAVFEHEFVAGATIEIAGTVPPGEVTIPARFRYQACDDTMCFAPNTAAFDWTFRVAAPGDAEGETMAAHAEAFGSLPFGTGDPPATERPPDPRVPRTTVSVPPGDDPLARLDRFTLISAPGDGGYMDAETFLEFIHNAETGATTRGLFEDRGLFAILAIAVLGGLLLNLTPCVLPMIPINLAIIGAGAQAGRRQRGFLLGATYGAAMAVAYGALGLIVILTAGTFGVINASPWFNVGIAALFVVLALAMFDVIAVDFSRLSSRIRFSERSRGTFLLAFGMGTVAALLAGACVAPVVIQVILFASDLYAKGSTAALALPFMLGVGMALPWPIAGAGMSALPKPGPWMVRVKQAFGVFILGMALYYGWLAFGLFANRWVDPADVQASVAAQLESGWHADIDAGLGEAERDGKLALIDIWATWCKNCLVMDRTTLVDPAVRAALEDYVKIKFQAEYPDEPPARDLMRRIGAIGLPAYAIFRPNGRAAGATVR